MALPISHDFEEHPIPALSLVNQGISRGGVQALIYKLMLLVGENMSKIQQVYAQNQISEGVIAKNSAKDTQEQTKIFLHKLDEQAAEQAKANKWSEAFTWLKWIGFAVGLILAACTAGSAAGFLLMAAPMALMASPVGNMAVTALGSVLAKQFGDTEEGKQLGNLFAQMIVLVVVTAVTFGGELVSAASEMAPEVAEEVTEEVASKGASFIATKMNFVQTLASTGLVSSIITQIVEHVSSGSKEEKQEIETWVGLIANLAVMALSVGVAYNNMETQGQGLLGKISAYFEDESKAIMVQRGISGLVGTTQATGATTEGGVGYYTLNLSQSQKELAPIRAGLMFGNNFFQLLQQLTTQSQKSYESLMEGNRILFETDFSADWRACAYQG